MNFFEAVQSHILDSFIQEYCKKATPYITKYIENPEDAEENLGSLVKLTQQIIIQLDKAGYTFQGSNTEDVSENTFKTTISRFKDFLESDPNDIESFNSQVRYILGLLDKHRQQYVPEGEILIDG